MYSNRQFEELRKFLKEQETKKESLRGVITPPERQLVRKLDDTLDELLEITMSRMSGVSTNENKALLYYMFLTAVVESCTAISFLSEVEDISTEEDLNKILKFCEVDTSKGLNNITKHLYDMLSDND